MSLKAMELYGDFNLFGSIVYRVAFVSGVVYFTVVKRRNLNFYGFYLNGEIQVGFSC